MTVKDSRRIVISLGGSIVAPPGGPDSKFLKALTAFFRRQAALGRRFAVVVGGGAPARRYMAAALSVGPVPSDRLDRIGIRATVLNASLVQAVLGELAHAEIVTDPRFPPRTAKPFVVAAGWKPGFSSDTDAVILAERYGADAVLNLSNISHVFDGDPSKDPSARPIERMSWADFRAAFGSGWTPGKSAPFDPVAARRAARAGLRVVVADGRDLRNLGNILNGRDFRGTVIG